MRNALAVLLTLACLSGHAAPPIPPASRAEIDGLLARLESSGCQFNRNGSWYPASEAKSHMLLKLKYLEARGAVQTAEQFIERAGSRSSMSGEPYLVKCGNGAPVQSGAWLTSELKSLRASGKPGTVP